MIAEKHELVFFLFQAMSVGCRKDVALQAVPISPEQHHRPGRHPVSFQCMQFVLTPSFLHCMA